ncbi:hypothetical protein LJB81_04750, partial [Desulfovibrio sp. OttesenSCG-928-M14]|nr:hypothetical protein [Desulfovibrio sp. OttesenSCG-928-M14]
MEGGTLLGAFVLRDSAYTDNLPLSGTGVWQAWQLPGGDVRVRALLEDATPGHDLRDLSKDDFNRLLLPLEQTPHGDSRRTVVPTLRSNTPDLLDIWYMQVLDASKTDSDTAEEQILLPSSVNSARPSPDKNQHSPITSDPVDAGTPFEKTLNDLKKETAVTPPPVPVSSLAGLRQARQMLRQTLSDKVEPEVKTTSGST